MTESSRHGRARAWTVFLLASPFAYGMYIFLLFLFDTFAGDQDMLYEYSIQKSRRKLAMQIIHGGWHAVPMLYAVGLLLLLIAWALVKRLGRRVVVLTGAVGAACGLVVAGLFTGTDISAITPSVLSGLLLGCLMGWLACGIRAFGGS